jgi:cell division protein FtsB
MISLLGLAGLWARLGGWISGGLSTVAAAIVRYPWQTMLMIAAFVCGLLVWRNDRLAEDAKQARTDQAQAEAALKVEQASNARLAASIAQQNAAVAQLGTDSAKAVAQGNRADADAVARSAGRAAQSARIIVPTGPVQPDCRTPDSVMAAKGGL